MIIAPETLRAHAERMQSALRADNADAAAREARHVSPPRGALLLSEQEPALALACLGAMPASRAGRILGAMAPDFAARLLLEAEADLLSSVLPEVPVDRAAALIRAAGRLEQADVLLGYLPADTAEEISALIEYPADTAGALMTTRYLAISADATVREALEVAADAPRDVEHRSYVYVVDGTDHLRGVAVITQLIGMDPDLPLLQACNREVVAARASDSSEEAARILRHRGFQALPLIDGDDRLVGTITLDDAMRLRTFEVAGNFTRVGAVSMDETFFTPPMGSVRRRLPWMGANVFLNLGAVAVIASFEDTIMQVAILAAFLPMITDMGGNVGIQALSVAIRSIALGEVQVRDYLRATQKELVIGLVNGAALGTLFALLAYFLQGNPWLGLVAGIALAVNVLLAGVIGGTLPFLIKRMGKDPAMMTGPVLTTITDITGVTIYLGLSTLFLTQILA